MKTMLMAALLLAPMTAALAAPNPFDGTWKTDLSSAKFSTKPEVLLLANGMFECKTCVPTVSVKADGVFHPVVGHPYYDEAMVKIVDAHSIEQTRRKASKMMGTSTETVSADGQTLTETFVDTSAENGVPVKGKTTARRIAAGPAGSHAISGSWVDAGVADISDAGLTMSYKTVGEMLTETTPVGQSFTAQFGGPAVAILGDVGKTMAAVTRSGPTNLVETDTRGGKVVAIYTSALAADGKSMRVDANDIEHGKTMSYTMIKQER